MTKYQQADAEFFTAFLAFDERHPTAAQAARLLRAEAALTVTRVVPDDQRRAKEAIAKFLEGLVQDNLRDETSAPKHP